MVNNDKADAAAPGSDIEGSHPHADRDWGDFLTTHRDRLRRMVAIRMDDRLRGRVDPSDVIQEAYLEAIERRPAYSRESEPMSPFLWLRFIALQRLRIVHRRHLGTQGRDPTHEVSIYGASPSASSAAIAERLMGRETRASELAMRAERKSRLEAALDEMNATDREVLVLRHFEQLSNAECATVLGIRTSAATQRYVRALKKLKDVLGAAPDRGSGMWP